MTMQPLALFELDETLPGYVHGIVSIDPPSVRCDGCGYTATGHHLNLLILTCGITFNTRVYATDQRRLCRNCKKTEWKDQ